MDTQAAPPAPYFDPQALRVELTALFNETGSADKSRQRVLDRLKGLVQDARTAAEAQLLRDGKGRRCAEGLSHFQDELIRLIYDYTIYHVYRAINPTSTERMAVVATGGYGRGLLAPGSDIDLLFLLPSKQTPWGESVAEHMLYMLWDLGFKVGHATRNVEQCIRLSEADLTIRTAVLDSRLILGDEDLFAELQRRFAHDVIRGTVRAFMEAKLAERDERHRRSGASRYRVEPNIKDGKGGLRDLHTLHWLAKYFYGETYGTAVGVAAISAGIFSKEEVATYRQCEDFLWTIRCHLHFLTGRAEERLSFDVQPVMAERLGYKAHRGLRAVERFMKHYFLIAKDVGDLTNILCSSLEMQQLISSPSLSQMLNPLSWRTRRQVRTRTDFRIDNGRINVGDQELFKRDPVNLVRLFAQAEALGVALHPDAVRLIRRSLRLIDDTLRADKEANRIFLELLTGRIGPEASLRNMNDTGVLGRFIPEFGRIVAMMQFNMYHHYTVDEHLLRTVGMVTEIERGIAVEELPLSTRIVKSIQNRRVLYVAAFLHDIGKGRDEDHSVVGARIARRLCPRFGLSPAETETVAWLIEEHLTMSNIAQSRDISDPKTISDFAAIVQTPERLKLLLLLTAADIRAVGPGTWNGWKGQLLRSLYYETEPRLSGGHTQLGRHQRVEEALAALRDELKDWPPADVDAFVDRHYPDYWLKTDAKKQAEHARLLRRSEQENRKLLTDFQTDSFTAITELNVLAPNHPRLLSLIAGACASAGANIVGAHISTTRDGLALDTFQLAREFEEDDDEARRTRRIGETIEKILKGEVWLDTLLAKRRQPEKRVRAFDVEPEVYIDNSLSDQFTVIEVAGLDRPGLLYALTSELSDLSLDITSAHVTTFGEKAVDVFYVTDLTAKKVTSQTRQKPIRERLTKVLREEGVEPAKT